MNPMPYTVKKVAALSRVSVRTLHFYDEIGLLKPAFYSSSGYRYYEEPQLLTLQQILFYRELGFELKQIKRVLGRRDFEKVAALKSHRKILQKKLAATSKLLETIDKTIQHLQGRKKMKTQEMFAGFSVPAGKDRHGDALILDGQPVNCKVSSQDTGGAMCVFETTVGWPLHQHHDQDEWLYVLEGELALYIAGKQVRVQAGESIFIPRKTPHGCSPDLDKPARVLNVYQPAGTIEQFFQQIADFKDLPTREQVEANTYREKQITALAEIFQAHHMDLLPPPWPVNLV
jgi:DNA-binding transcriptional MerR regulator/quercetin dioxygenase-like cupin family protein